MLRFILLLLGSLLVLDTVFVSNLSNGNLGTWLPAVLGVPLLVIGIFYAPVTEWFISGFGAAVKYALLASYGALILLLAVLCAILGTAGSKKPVRGDVLLVLGCAVRGERISLTLQHRLDTAYDYLMTYPDMPVVVSGGKGDGENLPEAVAMKRYLMQRGISEERILTEDASASTYDNFRFSKPLIEARLGREIENVKLVFVTTAFHVFRSEKTAEKLGISAYGIGAPGVWYITPNDYLRESLVVAAYRLMGRI